MVTETVQPSRFLDFFIENASRIKSQSQLIGDILVIEKIRFPEARVGSIVLANNSRLTPRDFTAENPLFYRVLLTGEGYYNAETGEDEPLEVKPGNIILTASVSVKLFSTFPLLELAESDILGITRYGDVQWLWKDEKEFISFLNDFNTSVKSKSISSSST